MEDSATPLTLRIEKAPKSPGYWVRLRLTNTSREPLVLNLRNLVGEATDASLPTALPEEHLYELEFVVKDHTGALPFLVDIKPVPLRAQDFKTLQPGQAYEQDVQLSSYFDIQPGQKYRIQCAYLNGEAGARFGVTAWKGVVLSNVLEVVFADKESES